MKRIVIFLLAAALLLCGCAGTEGQRDPGWEESWTAMGSHLAIESLEDFPLNESNDVLGISGLYYATWTCGEGQAYVNSDGKDAMVYDGQIYVLLKECSDADAAALEIATWIDLEKQSYEAGEQETLSVGSQEFQVLPLTNGKESNPYPAGISAFAVRGKNAISVELVYSDRYDGNPRETLERFLAGFHYAGE